MATKKRKPISLRSDIARFFLTKDKLKEKDSNPYWAWKAWALS